MEQIVRVGIISDSLLQQHLLRAVISEVGYDVAINIHPDKVTAALLQSETISMWVADIMDADCADHFLQDNLDYTVAPLFFGEGVSPDRQSEEFVGWRRRLVTKLTELSPPVQPKRAAPVVNFEDMVGLPQPPNVMPLPANLLQAEHGDIDQIWIVAASLGGPQPVKAFFDCLPEGIPAAFLYAQHIDAGCFDSLVKSIGRHTALEMITAVQGEKLENGKIVVVPVNNEIAFNPHHRIHIKNSGWSGPYGPSIDHLVQNAVERYGEKVNLIIFSGMGSDGTIGATLVQQAGGQVWSQTAESAVQSSMPDAASDAGCVTHRDTPEGLAQHLLQHMSVNARYTAVATTMGS